ncbi:LytS/YhcK type 5TM receptor domain-containing protein [uncultured Methanoregula sp.]|uniref:LytS/YhcK type 5TM receptor domain-containing protein n=1 Tax=uncultured Methanoregula sp. TaxID=1005933 RepID=UPI002AAA97E7|nr:LytS/YhcK type 5TM receptor domain-containing protein [uncultured Methanoregula sp.]
MDFSVLTQLNVLLQLMCVIIVAAYLLTRSRIFPEILDGRTTVTTQVILVLFFGALSVYGTISGVEFMGSVVNVRDLGPMLAGLLAGPWVGIGAGLIGAAYRFSMGGITVYSCSVTAVFAGLFGGLIWLYCKKKFAGWKIAVLFAILMEIFHMVLTLLIARPFDAALAIVGRVYIPMILANAIGMFVFAYMVRNFQNEQKIQAERDALIREKET